MPYQAPEILDRAALGDDKYTVTELADGRKQLTPSPDSVSEPGTEINKALLQPMADALERIDAAAVPYVLYWWRRRAVANGYSETRQTAAGETGVSHYSSTHNTTYYYLNAIRNYKSSPDSEWHTYYSTLTYASSISINQSTGAISLVNPSSYTFTASDNVSDPSVYTRFQGKFIKGFLEVESKVFFIPSNAYMETNSWTFAQGEEADEQGYEFSSDTLESHMPVLINSTKVTSTGSWETISADTSDAYPHSGESGGYEWAYCGRISDFTPSLYPLGIKTVNLTSASWNNGSYTLQLPCTRYFLWSDDVSVLVDNGKAYGPYRPYAGSANYRVLLAVGETSLAAIHTYVFTASGVTLTGSGSKTLFYLPLPS